MVVGVYPVLPSLILRWARKEQPSPSGRAIMGEWALSVAASALRPTGIAMSRGWRGQGPRPVIVLHGYAMSRSCFVLLARRLAARGLGPIVPFEYWSLGKTASAARSLGRFVDEVRRATGSDQVDLVGHSMGGLVARYYVTLGGGTDLVRNVVTLGSPHGGTYLSAFGFGSAQREFYPDSNLLTRLEKRIPDPVRTTVIWSRSDALVWSEKQAQLVGAHHEIVYDDLGHLGLLGSRRVSREVARALLRPGDTDSGR